MNINDWMRENGLDHATTGEGMDFERANREMHALYDLIAERRRELHPQWHNSPADYAAGILDGIFEALDAAEEKHGQLTGRGSMWEV